MEEADAKIITENITNFLIDKLYSADKIDIDEVTAELNVRLSKEHIFGPGSEPVAVNEKAIDDFFKALGKKGVLVEESGKWVLSASVRDVLKLFFDISSKFDEAESVLLKVVA